MVDRDVMVVMRDGVRLATDIYRPAPNGVPVAEPRPILLQRTPYDLRADDIVGIARFFVAHGYVVALQNLRGRYRSEGGSCPLAASHLRLCVVRASAPKACESSNFEL